MNLYIVSLILSVTQYFILFDFLWSLSPTHAKAYTLVVLVSWIVNGIIGAKSHENYKLGKPK